MVSRRAALVLVLLFAGVAAAQTVTISDGTTAELNDATVEMYLEVKERTSMTVYPDTLQIGDQNLTIDAPSKINVTLTRFMNDVEEDRYVANFTANSTAGNDVRFTIAGLQAGSEYQVLRDGSSYQSVETKSAGTISFNNSDWSPASRVFSVRHVGPQRIYLGDDSVTVDLGEERTSTLGLYNPADESETYTVTATTSMDSGSMVANLIVDGQRTDSDTVDVGADSRRELGIVVEGARCTTTCTGSATFQVESALTGEQYFAEMDVVVRRDQERFGSPGIGLVQVLVLALLGAVVALRRD